MVVKGKIGQGYDLHMHTTASDGLLVPRACVELASQRGLRGIAVTDHDTVAGVAEAVDAGGEHGVDVVPGVEISARGQAGDVHVLGLWVDPFDDAFAARLAANRDVRRGRNEAMLEALRRIGFDVRLEEAERIAAERRADGDVSVSRPHIAELLVRKGYVSTAREAFDSYLGEGASAYVAAERISPEEAIRWIREAGGVAVLAHPGLYRGADELIARLGPMLDGIEAGHADHTDEQERSFRDTAARLGLAATAGSDFHGVRDGDPFRAMLGSRRTDEETVERLFHNKKKRGILHDS